MPAARKKTKSVSQSSTATKSKANAKEQGKTTTKRNTRGGGRKRAAQDDDGVINGDSGDDMISHAVNGSSGKANKRSRRDVNYEEDVEGFQFSRATSKPTESKGPMLPNHVVEEVAEYNASPEVQPVKKKRGRPKKAVAPAETTETVPEPQPQLRRISFSSTPRISKEQPTDQQRTRPAKKTEKATTASKKQQPANPARSPPSLLPKANGRPARAQSPRTPRDPSPQKISLPFADTPVLRRNKEMRMQNNKKNAAGAGKQRRSSLGMRGRRASSLIASGASNALPHDEVPTSELYKHIESEGLPEPRRMRQLLTWCATRASAEQSNRKGQPTEDQSAVLTARVLQSELVNEFSRRSEMSDWFTREDGQTSAVVVKKPNPKNVQNVAKIKELEEKIQRLQKERESLKSLLQPPSILQIKPFEKGPRDRPQNGLSPLSRTSASINSSLLSASQQQLLNSLTLPVPPPSSAKSTVKPSSTTPSQEQEFSLSAVTSRLAKLTTSITPTLNIFASGIHDIDLFKDAADDAAGHVLSDCARRMEERDRVRRKKLFETFLDATSGGNNAAANDNGNHNEALTALVSKSDNEFEDMEDLRPILGALSRIETR